MKIQLAGDLHISKKGLHLEINPEADVLVLTGDLITVANSKKIKALFNSIRTRTEIPVLYVLGNHDYYNRTVEEAPNKYRKLSDRFDNIFLLDRDTKKIGDITFVGCTLWSKLSTWEDMISAVQGLNDFEYIKTHQRLITPDDYNNLHQKDLNWLMDILHLDQVSPQKKVIITHHAPSWRCVHESFRGSRLNPCFVSDLDRVIEEYSPELWLHGHTHQFHDLDIECTRVVNNPIGYEFETSGFKPEYLVEI